MRPPLAAKRVQLPNKRLSQ